MELSEEILKQEILREPRPGQLLLYQGRELRLVVEHSRRRPRITVDGNSLSVNFYELLPQPALLSVLLDWYRQQAVRTLTGRAGLWTEKIGKPFGRLSVRDQRSRWGSCSSGGNLNFNWRLIMAPPEVLDYVVIHEAAHLRELNHSPRFWEIVAEYDPEFRAHKLWLKKYGDVLFRLPAV